MLLSAVFGKNVRALMGLNNFHRQADLAEVVDLAPGTLSQKVNGISPVTLDELERIACALRVEPGALITDDQQALVQSWVKVTSGMGVN